MSPSAAKEPLTCPLSFAQERLWFLDRLEPGLSVYNVPEAFRLKGRLNHSALARSINEIVRRHESLRTTFAEVDGRPVQMAAASLNLDLAVQDLTHLEPRQREFEAARFVNDAANSPFDLVQGPLLRVMLLRLVEDEHVLLINAHHIVFEGGWSMAVFLRELNTIYERFRKDAPSPLPELEIQYGDYAVWQREWLQGATLREMLAYWKKQLEGAPALLDLAVDHARPATQSYAGSRESLLLPASLKSALQQLSARENATLFMTLLAGFKALLFRHTRQEDLLVGVPMAGRNAPETHDLIGFFVNTVVLRTDLSGEPSFRELVQRVRKVSTEALTHDEAPFELVVEALKPDRNQAYTPLFQVAFAYQNAPREPLQLTGITALPFDIDVRTSMFDLTLYLFEEPDGMRLCLEYARYLFEATTIRRLLLQFQLLLEAAVADPGRRISELPLLSSAEHEQVLYHWNNTGADQPRAECVHELLEEQVRKTPGAVAVVCEDRLLTYAELNARANRLAHHLRQLGVRPDARVAVCLERSLELVVAWVAVLKAGGAYVPLDPAYPAERIAYMLKDTGPVALLTHGSLLGLFAGRSESLPALDLAVAAPPWDRQPAENPGCSAVGLTPEHLAYVIYTSGSTGAPKGVMVPHRAINRLVCPNNLYADFRPEDRMAFASNPAFDAATMEVWAPLLNGGRVVVIPQSVLLEPARFREALDRHRVNFLWLTVGLFNQYADMLADRLSSLRYLIVGGDALDPRVIARVLAGKPPQHLLNGYGPTETTTFAATHKITAVAADARSIPIGRPIANTRIYILDSRRQPVPVGVAGELYISGAGVARGYLNRPELTAERFLDDPFVAGGQARMYKTGDLGRWLPDGTIEFLGRNDTQVKIRGFRIELGEIEATLAQYAGVHEAFVMARSDDAGHKRLVAYYTSKETVGVGPEQLRIHLAAKLPEYMVPAAYVRLDALPLTPNGKLDRGALPVPQADDFPVRGYESPVDDVQTRLARIWQDLLQVSPIGIRDNYFDLGGYSILAVRLFSEIRKTFGVELPLASLYSSPTIESLAALIAGNGEAQLWASLVPIRREGSKPPLYFVSGVGGGVLVFRDLALHLGDDQPVYALQPKRPGENESYSTSVAEMAGHYIGEILMEQPHGPYYIAGYSLGGLIAYEMAQQLTRAGHTLGFLAVFDSNAPLRIAKSNSSFVAQRNTGSQLARLAQLIRTRDLLRVVKRRLAGYALWSKERLSRRLQRPLPPELSTLTGSQAFAGVNYVGRPYAGSLTVFRSTERPAGEPWSYQLGWENIVTGGVEVHDVPGDHLTIYSGTNIEVLAAKLKSCLDLAQSRNEVAPIPESAEAETAAAAAR